MNERDRFFRAPPADRPRDRRGFALEDLALRLAQDCGCCGSAADAWYWDEVCDPERCRDRASTGDGSRRASDRIKE